MGRIIDLAKPVGWLTGVLLAGLVLAVPFRPGHWPDPLRADAALTQFATAVESR